MSIFRSFITLAVLLNMFLYSALAGTVQSLPPVTRPQKIRWTGQTVKLSISRSMLAGAVNIKYGSDVAGAIQRSMDAWQKVADIEFVEEFTDGQNVSPSGMAGDGVSLVTTAPSSENVQMFGKNDESSAAKTRIF